MTLRKKIWNFQLISSAAADCTVHIFADDEEIGSFDVGRNGGIITCPVKCVTGRHAVYLKVSSPYSGWTGEYFKARDLFNLRSFVFMK